MKAVKRLLFVLVILLGVVALVTYLLYGTNVAILNPKGIIAQKELNLLILASAISLVVVIPVFVLLFGILWRYRADNTKAKYSPDLDSNDAAEATYWAIPIVLIIILANITWISTHELDPYRPLVSDKRPLTVQVVALNWKWLFIYPEQQIATVNYLRIPTNTPINFEITSDAPMNSFWIPQLGGQIYAMPGMSSQLHLNATITGTFRGSSANISGSGFAGMVFNTQATTQEDFDSWVREAKASPNSLTLGVYDELTKPSSYNSVTLYSSKTPNLYAKVVMKYMAPTAQMGNMLGYGMTHE